MRNQQYKARLEEEEMERMVNSSQEVGEEFTYQLEMKRRKFLYQTERKPEDFVRPSRDES